MTSITLKEADTDEEQVIEIGSIRITGHLVDGKTVLNINALSAGDFILIQPVSANKIILKAGKTIKF